METNYKCRCNHCGESFQSYDPRDTLCDECFRMIEESGMPDIEDMQRSDADPGL